MDNENVMCPYNRPSFSLKKGNLAIGDHIGEAGRQDTE